MDCQFVYNSDTRELRFIFDVSLTVPFVLKYNPHIYENYLKDDKRKTRHIKWIVICTKRIFRYAEYVIRFNFLFTSFIY